MANQERVIVLSGASKGLGRAMTEGFIEAGHTVLGCSRNPESVAELQELYPAPHQFDVVDIAQDQEVKAWAEKILTDGTVPDLLINNAAIMNETNPVWEITAEEFDNLMQINVCGTANVLRHFVPAMVERESGVIVNFSSTWGRSTSPEVAPYCASKYAIEGLTKSLAQELPSGMAAIPFNPGIINTEMLQTCFGASASHYPTADQWAETAVPFILKISPSHNGQSLTAP
jgi:NAD(P)-dependent dehydrogenase (short-subunit alcohol dehydrogenase family)